jgi:hypothetical protein
VRKPQDRDDGLSRKDRRYVELVDQLVEHCPGHMRMVAILYHPKMGSLIIGSCCEKCADTLILAAAEGKGIGPRKEPSVH